MMSKPTILRLRRADPDADGAEYVVASVESNGLSALDLKVFGTDSEAEFKGTSEFSMLGRLWISRQLEC